ncbi:hypothetical protein CkaCkLH20_03092 [Colletotrichum karsti]|uniref:DUF6604 domain-containing protein n=1 Tax=Colletotrichum karsti TaxID=1095194 RepID=A0A9P6IBP5_9PEZI|nr:uncharacterized protein CkaCkLH20_03092 [Colletotrichum karsti]KAF9879549.1 hypothetical protein CkaCkLH20_03092 [Colletotrichum karsti]
MQHAPETLSHSYNTYKRQTALVLDWLADTYNALGVKAALVPAQTVAGLIRMAEACVDANRKMPARVEMALRQSIDLRRRCAAWFEKSGTTTSTIKHAYFNSALDEILMQFATSPNDNAVHNTPSKKTTRNIFSVLDDEGVGLLDEAVEKAASTFSTSNDEISPPWEQLQDLQLQDAEMSELMETSEAYFNSALVEVYCLFEDANKLRYYARTLWKRYMSGEVDLMSVSLLMQAVVTVVKDLIKGYETTRPDCPNEYLGLAEVVQFQAALGIFPVVYGDTDKELKAQAKELGQRFKDSSWQPSAEFLDWRFDSTYQMLVSKYRALDISEKNRTTKRLQKLVPPMWPKAEGLTILRRLIKISDDIESRSEEMIAYGMLDPFTVALNFDNEDHRKGITFAEVVVTRVLLDVYDLEGLMEKVRNDINHLKKYCENNNHFENYSAREKRSDPRYEPFCKDLAEISRPTSNLDEAPNPIFLGSCLFRVLEILRYTQVEKENEEWSLLAMAHLYHALKIIDQQPPEWKDMNVLIQLHEKDIFGGAAPAHFNQCLTRFYVAEGLRFNEAQAGGDRDEKAEKRRRPVHTMSYILSKRGLKGQAYHSESCRMLPVWFARRNTPGFRRELLPAPFLESVMMEMKSPYEGVFLERCKVLAEAMLHVANETSADVLAPFDALERRITSEMSTTVFNYRQLRRHAERIIRPIDYNGLALHRRITVNLGLPLSPYWKLLSSRIRKDGHLEEVTTSWVDLCSKTGLKPRIQISAIDK